MKPINKQILWDTIAPLDGAVERFAIDATVFAPRTVAEAGFDIQAIIMSYKEDDAKAFVWAKRDGEFVLFQFGYRKAEQNFTYPNETAAMWSFKLEAKDLYERQDTYWYWQSVPEWSKPSA